LRTLHRLVQASNGHGPRRRFCVQRHGQMPVIALVAGARSPVLARSPTDDGLWRWRGARRPVSPAGGVVADIQPDEHPPTNAAIAMVYHGGRHTSSRHAADGRRQFPSESPTGTIFGAVRPETFTRASTCRWAGATSLQVEPSGSQEPFASNGRNGSSPTRRITRPHVDYVVRLPSGRVVQLAAEGWRSDVPVGRPSSFYGLVHSGNSVP